MSCAKYIAQLRLARVEVERLRNRVARFEDRLAAARQRRNSLRGCLAVANRTIKQQEKILCRL